MTPSHATKPGKRYRYYITRPDLVDGSAPWRVSAPDVEKLVCERLADFLADGPALCAFAGDATAAAIQRMLAKADLMAATMRSGSSFARKDLIAGMVEQVMLTDQRINLAVLPAMLATALEVEVPDDQRRDDAIEPIILSLPIVRVRNGHQLRLVVPGPTPITPAPAQRDPKLLALLGEAMAARELVSDNPGVSLNALGAAHGRCRTRLGKLVAISCLAPDIVTAIVEGRQPSLLSASALMDMKLPGEWANQKAMLGVV